MRQLTLALLVLAVTACDDGGGGSEQDVAGDTTTDVVEEVAAPDASDDQLEDLDAVEDTAAERGLVACYDSECSSELEISIERTDSPSGAVATFSLAALTGEEVVGAVEVEAPELSWLLRTPGGTDSPWTVSAEPASVFSVQYIETTDVELPEARYEFRLASTSSAAPADAVVTVRAVWPEP